MGSCRLGGGLARQSGGVDMHRRRRLITGVAAAALLVGCALAIGAAARSSAATATFVSGGPPPGVPLDHFICYSVQVPAGGQPPPNPVQLQDEFVSQPETVRVQAPTTVCAPAAKIHGSLAVFPIFQDVHLNCFQIAPPASDV